MKNKEKTELIPELRFWVFPIKNWDEKKLQDIFIYLSTNTYSRNLLNNRQGIYQNIHYGDILVKYGSIIDAQKEEIPYINEDIECTTDNIIMDGDIIIADTAEDEIVGKTSEIFNIGDKKILSGLHTFWLRPLISFAPKYLGYFFNSTQYHNQLLPLIQGAKVSSISKKALNNTIIVYPSTSEQQKIADCLSSLDELIEATAQKVDALKEHKKGLMQRLFPAEGKNVPDLRFPEFQASEKWERKIIQDICNITTGNKNTQDKKENGIYPFFVRSPKVERIDSWSFDGEAILTAGDGVGVGKIFHYYVGKMGVHQRVYLLYDIQCNSKYLYYFFSEFFYERVKKMSAKNSVDSVRKDMISDMPLLLPSSQEQQKIADCLSSLDELIEATSQKVEILKEHKKGLMQQLFPKI